jgi:hypothetical protein
MNPARLSHQKLSRKLLNSFSLYLPLVLMGLLAVGSWWLARNTPVAGGGAWVRHPPHKNKHFLPPPPPRHCLNAANPIISSRTFL